MDLPRLYHAGVIFLLSLIKVTGFVDEGKPAHVIYLKFSKAFDSVLHDILVFRPGCYSLGGWKTTRGRR